MPGQLVLHIHRKKTAEHLFASCVTFAREKSKSVGIALEVWHQRSRSRRRLTGFNDRLLADIGIDRRQAKAEAAKWFWQR